MTFPIPTTWQAETAQSDRDQEKRQRSPCSFFYSQGRALVRAAAYFSDQRLITTIRGGVARKHRHRLRLALFGQLMASFEYMLKDFLAQILDTTDTFDEHLKSQKWLQVDVERILAQRVAQTTAGALLVHPTGGWHDPEEVNRRFSSILGNPIIEADDAKTLSRLWLVRHSVAHNAGFVTAPDAARIGSSGISEQVIAVDDDYMAQAFKFLAVIAKRTAEVCGRAVLIQWLRTVSNLAPNYDRDKYIYERLKLLSTYVPSRPTSLPAVSEADYLADLQAVQRKE